MFDFVSRTCYVMDGHTDLGILVTPEQRCSPHQAYVVVPHHGVDLIVVRHSEFVLEH